MRNLKKKGFKGGFKGRKIKLPKIVYDRNLLSLTGSAVDLKNSR